MHMLLQFLLKTEILALLLFVSRLYSFSDISSVSTITFLGAISS